jgi:hypothetical protein
MGSGTVTDGACISARSFAPRSRPALSVWFVCLLLARISLTGLECAADAADRDFTIFITSDVHVGAENLKADPPVTQQDTHARVTAGRDALLGLPGREYPSLPLPVGVPAGKVSVPRAWFILGDLTEGHPDPVNQEEQWQAFDELFPVMGLTVAGETVPVVAGAGNHDGPVHGPQRKGLIRRNRELEREGRLAAISTNGFHVALQWHGVHFISLNLCPADTTDAETPFRFGLPGPGSWNDPQGSFSFLKDYLVQKVGASGEPVILLQHYGFDGFSLNDWNWWTPKQRRALYELLKDYNVAAIFHGHNHHAEHYKWPDPKRHAADLQYFFAGATPETFRQYDVVSCGREGWVVRIFAGELIAVHFRGPDWNSAPAFLSQLPPGRTLKNR